MTTPACTTVGPRCSAARRIPRAPTTRSSWLHRAACSGRSALFDDAARVEDARAVCQRCPVLRDCRAWALANAVDGVAGGMTAAERTARRRSHGIAEPQVTVEEFMPLFVVGTDRRWGRGRCEAILDAVAELTAQGETAREIALRLDVTRRTVCRLRARCRQREGERDQRAATA